ncbi:ribonuclease H-like domain-containing protein [Tanacetum coccineum]
MDVNSDFLYEKIKEEVYVCQPPGFEDPDFSDRVYKVEKALSIDWFSDVSYISRPASWFAVSAGAIDTKSISQSQTRNGEEVQLHALVDGKKIIITESTVRRDLQLEDAEGVDCLSNSTIFEQLSLIGYEKISQKLTFYKPFFSPQWKFLIHTILQCLSPKTTAWNEFSSTMASAIIYLATNQKFNFSK